MTFTANNDLNILQASDVAVVSAGAGNDVYVVDASTLAAGQKITLSDTQGANTLRLVGGLEISASKAAATALQLNLSNGATINVLGADAFTYQTGGNPLNGGGSLSQNYALFASQSLGASMPTAAGAVVSGPAVTVNATGGTSYGGTPVPNVAPQTDAVAVTGSENATAISISLSGSDTDGSVASFVIKSLPSNGTLYSGANALKVGSVVNAALGAATVKFVPALNFSGNASFNFAAKDNAGLEDATPATAAIAVTAAVVNHAPTITDVAITSATGVQNNTLNAGDVVHVTVTMNETTTVTGTPQLALNIGGTTVLANYASGSGNKALVFQYTIQAGQTDTNGISIAANSLQFNGSLLKDAAGNNATITHAAVADNASYKVENTNLAAKAAAFSNTDADIGPLLSDSHSSVLSLATDYQWSSSNLTYSFNTSIPPEYYSTPARTSGWSELDATEKEVVRQAFSKLSALIPITFTETADNAGDLRFNAVVMEGTIAGFASFPGINALAGEVFLSMSNRGGNYAAGSYNYHTVIHEMGHAMGLKHPFQEPNILSASLDNYAYTVMSYTGTKSLLAIFTADRPSYTSDATPASWSILDIAALQSMYGANTAYRTGDDTYDVLFSQKSYLAIWDAGGSDCINASAATGACTVDLRPGQLSSLDVHTMAMQEADTQAYYRSIGKTWLDSWVTNIYATPWIADHLFTGENSVGIANGVWIENVNTGSAADTVLDNAVDNIISTNAGNDIINLFGGGFDTVDGGSGLDTVCVNGKYAETQIENMTDGSYLVMGSYYAAKLINVESIVCNDGTFTLI